MRPNALIPPLCCVVLFAAAGCDNSSSDTGSGGTAGTMAMPGADPLVATWNLENDDGAAYPYSYTDEDGCKVVVSGQVTFDASLRGTLRFHYDYGSGCGDEAEDGYEDMANFEAVTAGGGAYEVIAKNVAIDEYSGVHESFTMHCTLEDANLECEDDEGVTIVFARA